jgi:16S rRNA (uracil1498-N3)-methyltransferase
MECLYTPHLLETAQTLALGDEARSHARALRLREGERVLLSNGAGLCARASIHTIRSNEVLCALHEILPEYGELPYRLILALGILDNRERMEFSIEKAVELGVSEIVPLLTQHSERYAANRIKPERMIAKALAAMQQSHRARLPQIHAPMSVEALRNSLQTLLPNDSAIILADVDGQSPHPLPARNTSICLCVGAEGGFSEGERDLLKQDQRTVAWKLAPRRLRAETAAIMGLSAVTLMSAGA